MKKRFATICLALVFSIVLTAMVLPSAGHTAVTIKAQLIKGAYNGLNPNDAVWNKATLYKVTLDTVITATGIPQRLPSSKFKTLKVKAIHNGTDVFFRYEWPDGTSDTSVADPTLFADAMAMEIAFGSNSSIAMGNQLQPVNILFWRADMGDPVTGLGHLQNIVAGGAGTVQKTPDSDALPVSHSQTRAAGGWTVIMQRPLSGASSANGNLINLVPGSNYRITFAEWDGSNAERDAVKLVAGSWQTLYINAK